MVRIVYEASEDQSVLERALPALLAEHAYWTSPPKQVEVLSPDGSTTYNLSRYYADWDTPRPESYRCVASAGAGVLVGSQSHVLQVHVFPCTITRPSFLPV